MRSVFLLALLFAGANAWDFKALVSSVSSSVSRLAEDAKEGLEQIREKAASNKNILTGSTLKFKTDVTKVGNTISTISKNLMDGIEDFARDRDRVADLSLTAVASKVVDKAQDIQKSLSSKADAIKQKVQDDMVDLAGSLKEVIADAKDIKFTGIVSKVDDATKDAINAIKNIHDRIDVDVENIREKTEDFIDKFQEVGSEIQKKTGDLVDKLVQDAKDRVGDIKEDFQGCCKAFTAECLSCAAGVALDKYCSKFPKALGCECVKPICKPSTQPTCRYVKNDQKALNGCPRYPCGQLKCGFPASKPTPAPWRACCRALTAECMSCSQGLTVEEYCEKNKGTKVIGCPKPEPVDKTSPIAPVVDPKPPVVCCLAMTASCLSCSEGVTVNEYCEKKPQTFGCPTTNECHMNIKDTEKCEKIELRGKCHKKVHQKNCYATCNRCRGVCTNRKGDDWCVKRANKAAARGRNMCTKNIINTRHCRKTCRQC